MGVFWKDNNRGCWLTVKDRAVYFADGSRNDTSFWQRANGKHMVNASTGGLPLIPRFP